MIDINIIERQTQSARILENANIITRLSAHSVADRSGQLTCPSCDSTNIVDIYGRYGTAHHCRACNHEWQAAEEVQVPERVPSVVTWLSAPSFPGVRAAILRRLASFRRLARA